MKAARVIEALAPAPEAAAPAPRIDPALLLRRGLPAALAKPLAKLAEAIELAPNFKAGETVWMVTATPRTPPANRGEAIEAARALAEEAALEGARGALIFPEVSSRGRWHLHGLILADLDSAAFAENAWRSADRDDRAADVALKVDLLEVTPRDAQRALVYLLKSQPLEEPRRLEETVALFDLKNTWDFFVEAAAAAGVTQINGHQAPPRKRKRRSTAVRHDGCSECGASLASKRAGALTCSNRCRMARSRRLAAMAESAAEDVKVKPAGKLAPAKSPTAEAAEVEKDQKMKVTDVTPLGRGLEPSPKSPGRAPSQSENTGVLAPKSGEDAKSTAEQEKGTGVLAPKSGEDARPRLICRWDLSNDPNIANDFKMIVPDWEAEHDLAGEEDPEDFLPPKPEIRATAAKTAKTATASKKPGKARKKR